MNWPQCRHRKPWGTQPFTRARGYTFIPSQDFLGKLLLYLMLRRGLIVLTSSWAHPICFGLALCRLLCSLSGSGKGPTSHSINIFGLMDQCALEKSFSLSMPVGKCGSYIHNAFRRQRPPNTFMWKPLAMRIPSMVCWVIKMTYLPNGQNNDLLWRVVVTPKPQSWVWHQLWCPVHRDNSGIHYLKAPSRQYWGNSS